MASSPIISWKREREKVEAVSAFYFLELKITVYGDCSHEIKRRLFLGRKAMTNLNSILKSRDITLPTKVCIDKAMVFPVIMYGYESWAIKKAEHQRIDVFQTMVLQNALESSLDSKIKLVNPKGNQLWIFIGNTDVDAEVSILWPPNGKSWLTEKDPDTGRDWRQKERRVAEDDMIR